MATIDLDVTSVIAAAGWTAATVGNLDKQDDVRATDGQKNEFISCEVDDVPGDFSSMNSVVLHVEGKRTAAGDRTMAFQAELRNSIETVLETFLPANLGTSDVQYDSTSRTRSDSSTVINGWRYRIIVLEGGGMPGGNDQCEVDRMWLTLDYNPVAAGDDFPVTPKKTEPLIYNRS